jgi:putative DNA primase/helicase
MTAVNASTQMPAASSAPLITPIMPGAGVELTAIAKGTEADLPERRLLGKRISLDPKGRLIKDASGCYITRGAAQAIVLCPAETLAAQGLTPETAGLTLDTLAGWLRRLKPHNALALGRLAPDLPRRVILTTKGGEAPARGVVSRSQGFFTFATGMPALMLLDIDWAGAPAPLASKRNGTDGTWGMLVAALPALAGCASLERASSSAGLRDGRTGREPEGTEGLHLYLPVLDGADIPRALKVLNARLTLAGLGWVLPSAAGHALHRTPADAAVGGPERLVFEGAPLVVPPLEQRADARDPTIFDGSWLDTRVALPDLSDEEQDALRRVQAENETAVADKLAAARHHYTARETQKLREAGATVADARERVRARIETRELHHDDLLHFDDVPEPMPVSTLLADPQLLAHFDGATLRDPIEPERGPNKAVFYARGRRDGLPLVRSLIHGGISYYPRHTLASLRLAQRMSPADAERLTIEALASGLAPLGATAADDALAAAVTEAGEAKTKNAITRRLSLLRSDLKLRKAERDSATAREAFAMLPAGPTPAGIPIGFSRREAGWFHQRGNTPPTKFAGPFDILGAVADEAGAGQGLALRWPDREGRVQSHVVSLGNLVSDLPGTLATLADRGLLVVPTTAARESFVRLLHAWPVVHEARLLRRVGVAPGLRAFMLPGGRAIGPDADRAILAPGVAGNPLARAGNLDAWRGGVAAKAPGNPILTLALSVAFSSVTADLLGLPGAIFHLFGVSSTGKTTAVRTAASVWGPPGAGGVFTTWRGTAAGFEAHFVAASGLGLVLDELGQADPELVSALAYAHSTGAGKVRARRDGDAQQARNWVCDVLSTGELTLRAALARGRKNPDAGQLVRLLDIPAELPGARHRAFDKLHGAENGATFTRALDASARAHHGHAGLAFVEWLLAHEQPQDLARAALREADMALAARLGAGELGAQAERIRTHFIRVAATGEMATTAGVTGWAPGEATKAALIAFQGHIHARPSGGRDAEADEAIRRTRNAIELYPGRFLDAGEARDGSPFAEEDENARRAAHFLDDAPPDALQLPTPAARSNYAASYSEVWGHRVMRRGQNGWAITQAGWTAIHRGFDPVASARALRDKDLLLADAGTLTTKIRLTDGSRPRVYFVKANILETGESTQ